MSDSNVYVNDIILFRMYMNHVCTISCMNRASYVEEAVESVGLIEIHKLTHLDQFVSIQCSREGQGPGFGISRHWVASAVHKGLRSRTFHSVREEGAGSVPPPSQFQF